MVAVKQMIIPQECFENDPPVELGLVEGQFDSERRPTWIIPANANDA